jgi:hypothetical protein
MGELVRCESCGQVRWSVLMGAEGSDAGLCDVCGEPLSLERRRPGRRLAPRAKDERRDFHPAAQPPA